MEHRKPVTPFSSKFEVLSDGTIYYDYRTAHARVGDASYQVWLPATCYTCWQQALSAEEAGFSQTAPDQEDVDDPATA